MAVSGMGAQGIVECQNLDRATGTKKSLETGREIKLSENSSKRQAGESVGYGNTHLTIRMPLPQDSR